MNYVPIKVNFSTDTHDVVFGIEEPTKVRFNVSYRKGKAKRKYAGDGYVGEPLANERLG